MALNLWDSTSFCELEWLSVRWGVPQADILGSGAEGELEMAIYADELSLFCGKFIKQANGPDQKTGVVRFHCGVLPLRTEDVEKAVIHGFVETRRFRPRPGEDFRELDSDQPSRRIEIKDLVVSWDKAMAFERDRKFNVRETMERPSAVNPQTYYNLVVADSQYKVVSLGPTHWNLGQLQSQIVRMLHQASLTDQPWVSGSKLLLDAGSQTMRFKDLFKGKSDWRELILSDGRGLYRLNCAPNLWREE